MADIQGGQQQVEVQDWLKLRSDHKLVLLGFCLYFQ